jgi:hypothetical protein
MSKSISIQAGNKLNLAGILMDVTPGNGTLADGRPYKRATVTIRVTQTYGGKTETSDIQVGMFATEFTSTGKPNPAWKSLKDLELMRTAQNVGIDNASHVRLTGATLQENNFVSRNGQLINGWQIRGSFINEVKVSDVASFVTDIFIMSMDDEVNREGDTTGRLKIKGGIVQYGGKLDVIDFIVEAPDTVEYISRNWEVNGTVTVKGRIRVLSQEEEVQSSGWGEEVPDTTTRFVRELIITTGDDECKEEDFAYDPVEIKKAFNERKAAIEQLQINARATAPKQGAGSANSAEASSKKYDWE